MSGLYLGAGAVLGLAGGWIFHRVWRRLLPRAHSRQFWRTLPESVRGMLASEASADLFRHYRTLLAATLGFATRNTLAVLAGIAPVAAFFLLLHAVDPSRDLAAEVAIEPAASVAPRAPGDWRLDDERLLIERSALRESPVELAGRTLGPDTVAEKQAFCRTAVSCLLFEMMLFETHDLDPGAGDRLAGPVVVRPAMLDGNPLWPYLNDLDFSYFLAVMAGSAAAAWRSRNRRADPP